MMQSIENIKLNRDVNGLMNANRLILRLRDKKLIGSKIHFSSDDSRIIIKMGRSRFLIKIPLDVNPTISYLTGIIMGDGNITCISRKVSKYPRTKIRIFNESEIFIKKVAKLFYRSFNYNPVISKKKDKNCFILTINNKIIYSYFVNVIGLEPKKKSSLRVPKLVSNSRLFRYFLAGLFDTDGYHTNSFGIMMSGGNYHFLRQISYFSKSFYDLNFLKICKDTILLNGKSFSRAQLNLSKYSEAKFEKSIPLGNEKWWAGQDSNLRPSPILDGL